MCFVVTSLFASSVKTHFVKDMGIRKFACLYYSLPCIWSFKMTYLERIVTRSVRHWSSNVGLGNKFYVAEVLMCVEERCHCIVALFEKLPEF